MGLPGFSEYNILRTNKEEILKAKRVLELLEAGQAGIDSGKGE